LRVSSSLGIKDEDVRDVAAAVFAARGRDGRGIRFESTEESRSSDAKPLESPPRQNLRGSIRKLEFPKGTLKSPQKRSLNQLNNQLNNGACLRVCEKRHLVLGIGYLAEPRPKARAQGLTETWRATSLR